MPFNQSAGMRSHTVPSCQCICSRTNTICYVSSWHVHLPPNWSLVAAVVQTTICTCFLCLHVVYFCTWTSYKKCKLHVCRWIKYFIIMLERIRLVRANEALASDILILLQCLKSRELEHPLSHTHICTCTQMHTCAKAHILYIHVYVHTERKDGSS